jgi:hypothetical protein
MITAAQCEEFADYYKRLSQAEGISKNRETALKNIARSFKGLAGQLDRLAAFGRDEVRRPPQSIADGTSVGGFYP